MSIKDIRRFFNLLNNNKQFSEDIINEAANPQVWNELLHSHGVEYNPDEFIRIVSMNRQQFRTSGSSKQQSRVTRINAA